MKECPNCGEIVGDNVQACFKCQYNFVMGRVMSKQETSEKSAEISKEMAKLKREEEKNRSLPFILSTTDFIDGCEIISYKGVVNGDIVMGTGFLSEFGASFSDLLGTRAIEFENKLNTAKTRAYTIMIERAQKVGANAIIGIKFSTSVTTSNMLLVSCIGTAVVRKIKNDATH